MYSYQILGDWILRSSIALISILLLSSVVTAGTQDNNRADEGISEFFSSFIGGDDDDRSNSCEIDPDGNIVVLGSTKSTNFPGVTDIIGDDIDRSTKNLFVSIIDPSGTTMLQNIIIGGSGEEEPWDMVIDEAGDVIITGATSSPDFPVTNDAFDGSFSGGTDVFLCRLSGDPLILEYSTYIGGSANDTARCIELDGEGCLILSGDTDSTDFPTSDGAMSTDNSGTYDGFITVFDPVNKTLAYSTYLGASGYDQIFAARIGPSSDIYLLGITNSEDFPVSDRPLQDSFQGGDTDLFVSRIKSDPWTLVYSTYVGGNHYDQAHDIVIPPIGEPIFIGTTYSMDFPNISRDLQEYRGSDIVLFQLDLNGEALERSVFIDGYANDVASKGAVDRFGDVYLLGWSSSQGLWTSSDAVQRNLTGEDDGLLVRFDGETLEPEYATYLGGSEDDYFTDVVVDGDRHAYVVGLSSSSDFPTTRNSFQERFGYGEFDGFVARLTTYTDVTHPEAVAGEDVTVDQHWTVQFDAIGSSDDTRIVNWNWSFVYDGASVDLTGETVSFLFDNAGKYLVSLNVSDAAGNWGLDMVNVTVLDITAPEARAGQDRDVDQNDVVTLDASASSDNVGIMNWTWTIEFEGIVTTLFGMIVQHTLDEVGVYTVHLNVTDAVGNHDSDQCSITAIDTEEPIADAGLDLMVDQHEAFTLDGTGSSDNVGIVNWTWTVQIQGGEERAFTETAVFTIEDAGSYMVTLTVTDAEGNQATDSLAVTVADVTEPIADAGDDRVTELDERVVLDGSGSTDNLGIVQWLWEFEYDGGTVTLEGAEVGHVFRVPGRYTVSLTVTDDAGNSATDTVVVEVEEEGLVASPFFWGIVIAAIVVVVLVLWWVRQRGN